ncbi:MAG: DUF1819 family protein [Endozoicomonadaceae bacterium]|nr:DUF1819 family protein [Endozoicomonadaceae bacterium]
MAANHYSLSFTTGSALIREAIDVAALKCELVDWAEVRAYVLEHNTFQSRTVSTLKKLYGEVSRRLQYLNDDKLSLLANGSESEQKQLLWLALCRRYSLISDFSVEVLSHQFEAARYTVTHDDYDAFFNAKAEWHDSLDGASTQTKSKARQVLFKMLRECGLINEHDEIVRQQIAKAWVSPDIYKGSRIQQLKANTDSLSNELNDLLVKEREVAIGSIESLKDKLTGFDEYQALDQGKQTQLASDFDTAIDKLNKQNLIAMLRDEVHRFEEQSYSSLVQKLRAWSQPEPEHTPESATADEGEPASQPEVAEPEPQAAPEAIAIRHVRVNYHKPWLAAENDVNEYLEEYRKALLGAIKEGKHIQL